MINMIKNMFNWLKNSKEPKLNKDNLKDWDVSEETNFNKIFKGFKNNNY